MNPISTEGLVAWVLAVMAVLMVSGAIFFSCEEDAAWEERKKSCELTGRQRLRNSTQYTGNSIITVAVAQDEWLCGSEHLWRDTE